MVLLTLMSDQPLVHEGGRLGGRQSGRKCGDVDDYLSDHGISNCYACLFQQSPVFKIIALGNVTTIRERLLTPGTLALYVRGSFFILPIITPNLQNIFEKFAYTKNGNID